MTILVAYIPTREGEAALRSAVDQARLLRERLLVLNTSRGDAEADPRLAGDGQLDAVRRDLTELEVSFEIKQLRRGRDAADEVVSCARAEAASLIVIGIRHRNPVGKLILGSAAQRILLDAPCPVLAVKAD